LAASTLLKLTNDVLRHFNEVELTSTTLGTAVGFHSAVIDYVNDAIRDISQTEKQWPFNWAEAEVTLVPGQADPQLYALESLAETVDWQTFTLVRDDTLDIKEKPLVYLEYDDWYKTHRATDKDQVGTTLGIQPPKYVFRTKNSEFGVSPIPDRAYKVRYEYWTYAVDLAAHDDTSTIDARFDNVIKKGALASCYHFRQNAEVGNTYEKKFRKGVLDMRELLINHDLKTRDTRTGRSG